MPLSGLVYSASLSSAALALIAAVIASNSACRSSSLSTISGVKGSGSTMVASGVASSGSSGLSPSKLSSSQASKA